jgi:serine/alanine adding enzyme
LNVLNNELEKKVTYTEFRNFNNVELLKGVFSYQGYNYEEYLNFILPVSSVEANMKLVKRDKRSQIIKSINLGAEIVEPNNIDQVKEFYLLLRKFYRGKVKKPLPPFCFFEKFYYQKELGIYLLIKYKNKIVNGVMAPIFNNTIYDWYGNISSLEYQETYSGVLSTWATIEYAAKNGLKYVDFLGAGKPSEAYGVREFKAKFGGNLVNYGRFIKINNQTLYNVGKLGLKIIGKFRK